MSRVRALTREEIRTANQRKLVEVPIEEWGGVIYVKKLSAGEGMTFGDSLVGLAKAESLAAQLAEFICDEEGKPIYTKETALAELVNDGLPEPVKRALIVALEANGMVKEETVKGNSLPSPSA